MATTAAERWAGPDLARLHLVTPAGDAGYLVAAVGQALSGGAPLIQLRLKGGSDRARWSLAEAVSERCRQVGARLVVNDRADLARAVGADGVHVGDDDLPVAAVRRVLGPTAVVGATCRDPEAARRAEAEGATYLGVGPAYATSTKEGLPHPLGPSGVGRVAAAVAIPVVAVGGVTAERVPELLDAGCHGVAVSAAVFAAPDPRAAAGELVATIEGWSRR